ncbi:MAG: BMC domain-containing protein [Candidatus Sericytochromatia bacterium]|nr:BMC domain-containing protein [Candidatus Sericytochromatia bacterium]
MRPPDPAHPAIALLELASIAQGYFLADLVIKKAPVHLLEADAVSPGKFLLLFSGDVASVRESHEAALACGAGEVIDTLFLPHVHAQVPAALAGETLEASLDAVGVYELFTVASAIACADAALKAADIRLLTLRIARGIGGKAFFTLTGSQSDVEAALEAADQLAVPGGTRVRRIVIPNPHGEFLSWLQPPRH